jgi:hypothetical protein
MKSKYSEFQVTTANARQCNKQGNDEGVGVREGAELGVKHLGRPSLAGPSKLLPEILPATVWRK